MAGDTASQGYIDGCNIREREGESVLFDENIPAF